MDKIERAGDSRESMSDKEWIEDAWNSLMKFEPREVNSVAPPEKPAPEPLVTEPVETAKIAPAKVPTPEPLLMPETPPPVPLDPKPMVDSLYEVQKEFEAEPEPDRLDEAVAQKVAEDTAEQREQKLMMLIMKGNPDVLKQTETKISDDEREKVMDVIKSGEIKINDWKDILENVERPVDSKPAEVIHGEVAGDNYATEILARVSGAGLENADKTNAEMVERLAKNCDTPIAFECRVGMMMNGMREGFEQELAKYKAAAEKLERAIYGEQMDYWATAKELIEEAGK